MIETKKVKDLYIDYEKALIDWRKYEITDIERNKIGNKKYICLDCIYEFIDANAHLSKSDLINKFVKELPLT